jgi:cytoskeletal protein RodZ
MAAGSDSENPGKPGERRFRRTLTPFLCQEMLYDYATDRLDAERRRAVDEYLPGDRSCQEILDFVQTGLRASSLLAESEVSDEWVQKLSEAENVVSLGHRYSSWKEWPDTLRWSVGAVGASVALALLIMIIPWNRMHRAAPDSTLTVAPIANSTTANLSDDQEIREAQEAQPPESEVAEDAEDSGDAGDEGGAPVAAVMPPTTLPPVAVVAHAKPTPAANPPPVVNVAAKSNAAESEEGESKSETAAQTAAGATGKPSNKPKGFVYRGVMNLANLEEVAPQITEQIRELGAEKAGEVELGWRRGNKGSYYHFTLPEANQEKLLEVLKAYGPVSFSKDPHARIMPEGQVRYILWIEPLKQ